MLYHIKKLMFNSINYKFILNKLLIVLILLILILYKNVYAVEFDVYKHLKELKIGEVMFVNEPFFDGLCRNIKMYTPQFRRVGISAECENNFERKKEFIYNYRSPWVYFPMNGKFLRLTAIGEIDKSSFVYTENGVRYVAKGRNDQDISYDLFLSYEEMNNKNKNMPPLKLNTKNLVGQDFAQLEWYALFGVNCVQDALSENLTCYNELNTYGYERFMFTNDDMRMFKTKKILETFTEIGTTFDSVWNKYKDLDTKNTYYSYSKKNILNDKTEVIIRKNLEYNEYENTTTEQNLNVKTFWKGYLKQNQTMEDYIVKQLKNISNDKVLIMIPYNQVKNFMKIVKKIPTNELKNIKGYVWFLSRERSDFYSRELPYNPKKYDVLPNEKYDSELSRISNGNLKAKYGRYLTKERYSENYIAPSIYNNNYNDEPEW